MDLKLVATSNLVATQQVLASIAHAEQRRDDQVIGVGFGEHAADEAASDAIKRAARHAPSIPSCLAIRMS